MSVLEKAKGLIKKLANKEELFPPDFSQTLRKPKKRLLFS